MLKVATKPKWIAALVFALAVAAVFVLLSQWQFSRSLEKDVAPPAVTEKAQPLLSVLKPGVPLLGTGEGQVVRATGHFDPAKQVIVDSRVQDGEVGHWVVTAFVIDGAPVLEGVAASKEVVIPVARGWISDPSKATDPPAGTLTVEGRLLNAEAPEVAKSLAQGHVSALSSAELTNVWKTTTLAAFVVSAQEVNAAGSDVGASASNAGMTPITVTATDQNNKINWLNIFYSIEWVLFAGFAVFMWWRLVADDYRREQDELFDVDRDDDEHTPVSDSGEPVS
ncbi:SURF1 family protein [Arthrobacter cryoconiti]|uniref:SURF1-like protein n=1 Tax=Arthrobacter cryoconiti TaxID=748907 RepID=A0ABV8QZE2_9MICC|nr:SURF1 family protein [Arthrobacter cryoconiti]MCC9069293.1 SURF1 family protein [Arthrobacter cryoconiti]